MCVCAYEFVCVWVCCWYLCWAEWRSKDQFIAKNASAGIVELWLLGILCHIWGYASRMDDLLLARYYLLGFFHSNESAYMAWIVGAMTHIKYISITTIIELNEPYDISTSLWYYIELKWKRSFVACRNNDIMHFRCWIEMEWRLELDFNSKFRARHVWAFTYNSNDFLVFRTSNFNIHGHRPMHFIVFHLKLTNICSNEVIDSQLSTILKIGILPKNQFDSNHVRFASESTLNALSVIKTLQACNKRHNYYNS